MILVIRKEVLHSQSVRREIKDSSLLQDLENISLMIDWLNPICSLYLWERPRELILRTNLKRNSQARVNIKKTQISKRLQSPSPFNKNENTSWRQLLALENMSTLINLIRATHRLTQLGRLRDRSLQIKLPKNSLDQEITLS